MLWVVTHDEVRPRLAAYAAGDLDAVAAEEIRAHLAGGCESCLQELFGRPVGLPRAAPEPPAPPPVSADPEPVASDAPPRARGLVVAVVLLAAALATTVGWMVVELRARDAARRAEATRAARELIAAEHARAAAQARAAGLDRDVAELRDSLARAAQAPPPPDDPGLREELDSARGRITALTQTLHRRERALQRSIGDGSAEAMREAVEAPNVELLRLGPVAPFRDVRGHALWHPGAERVLLYAYGLPPLSDGGRYRVDVELADGRRLGGPTFPVNASGQVTVPVRVEPSGESPRALRVVLEPGGRPVLDWRRAGGS
jgi:hypothetical protein